jgi:lysyl-tRNA synthetase class 1
MADFLPPEILRFLLIRPFPKQPVNFEPSEVYIIKLFNDFDRFLNKYYNDPKITDDEKRVYELSQVDAEPAHWVADFQLVAALTQMPHLDLVKELEKRKGSALTEIERKHLNLRIRAANYWVQHYATEEEKTRLQPTLPARAEELTATQRAFLHVLASLLPVVTWEGDAIQACLFTAARLTPIDQPSAFKAVYRVLLDRDNGPKAGNFLSFLDREFVVRRCQEVTVDKARFWQETSIAPATFQEWLVKEQQNITQGKTQILREGDMTVREFDITMKDGKIHRRRIVLTGDKEGWESLQQIVPFAAL